RSGDDYMIEDMESTNGTFVNRQRVTRHALEDGDVILVGKHTLVFDRKGGETVVVDDATPFMPKMGNTVFLDSELHKALLSNLNSGAPDGDPAGILTTAKLPTSASAAKVGVLRVMNGGGDHREYYLEAQTSLIGKDETSLVRLKGWFKPAVAVAITRNGQGYVATRLGGRTFVNGQPLARRHGLTDGDILRISGLTLEFRLR